MQHPVHLLKVAYHFFAEGLIAFLLLVPFLHYTAGLSAYWIYLITLFSICLTFSIYAHYTERLFWYVATAPLFIMLYFLLGFPILSGAVFAAILTWRYIVIRQEMYLQKEAHYIQITGIIAILLILMFKTWEPAVYLALQFFVVLLGNGLVQLLKMDQVNQNAIFPAVMKLFGGFLLTGSIGILLLYKIGTPVFLVFWDRIMVPVWDAVTKLIALIFTLPFYLWNLLNISLPMREIKFLEQPEAEETGEPDILPHTLLDNKENPYLLWLVIGLATAIVLYFVWKAARRRFTFQATKQEKQLDMQYMKMDKDKKESLTKAIINKLFHQPNNPVRKLIFQFEQQTNKIGYGRQPSETLAEWLSRINLIADIDVYEQVRYGEGSYTKQDLDRLRQGLHHWKAEEGGGQRNGEN